MTVIWGVSSLNAGEAKFFWPAAPLGIWAAVLMAIAVWPGGGDRHGGGGGTG